MTPGGRVEVLDDSGVMVQQGTTMKVRTIHWKQHALWSPPHVKIEEIRSTAVLTSGAQKSGYIENLRMKRHDSHVINLHWSHRFILTPAEPGPDGRSRTKLSETESLQSHRAIILMEQTGFRPHELRANTNNFHDILFRNIKASIEKLHGTA